MGEIASKLVTLATLLMAVLDISSASAQTAHRGEGRNPPGTQISPAGAVIPDQSRAIPLRPRDRRALPEQWTQHGPYWSVRNVANATLTPYLPAAGTGSGTAVIVAPGGGFLSLAYSYEGTMVAQWFADHGVAAFLLKYRLNHTPRGLGDTQPIQALPVASGTVREATPEALADAQAAVRLVRARAAEWHIDENRVGFVGFSAGAITAVSVGLSGDAADRPNFIAPIYPQMSARPVPAYAPPMFVAVALDDPLFGRGSDLGLIQSWRAANVRVEAHLYSRGGHGFGMTQRSAASALWIDELFAWMRDAQLVPQH